MEQDYAGISVIMPTYKHARFITRALASLLAQTFRDWELILINDGSPDDTHALVQPCLADPRVCYLRNDRNEGLGHCLNQGLPATPSSPTCRPTTCTTGTTSGHCLRR